MHDTVISCSCESLVSTAITRGSIRAALISATPVSSSTTLSFLSNANPSADAGPPDPVPCAPNCPGSTGPDDPAAAGAGTAASTGAASGGAAGAVGAGGC